jgi:hypothetical protein
MQETSSNLEMISSNLTSSEFKGFCKGMIISRIARGLERKNKTHNASKQVDFWDKAYERYKHNCQS